MSGTSTALSRSATGASLGQVSWAPVAAAPFTRRAWRELLYALVAFPLGVVGFGFVVASSLLGVYLSIIGVGLVLLALSTLGVRRLGAFNRSLVGRFLDEDVPQPAPFQPRPGVVGWIRSGIADRVGWRARAYLVLKFPLALAGLVAVFAFRIVSLWFVLAPVQWATNIGAERENGGGVPHHYVINFGSFYFDTWSRTLVLTAIGIIGWWLAPWVLRAILYLDRRFVVDLLGPISLPSRIRQLEKARAVAVDEVSTRLRRVERDLHDGAQAELVGLAMKLGLAQEKLAQVPDPGSSAFAQARRLVDEAHDRADVALRQLRELARGIHPS